MQHHMSASPQKLPEAMYVEKPKRKYFGTGEVLLEATHKWVFMVLLLRKFYI